MKKLMFAAAIAASAAAFAVPINAVSFENGGDYNPNGANSYFYFAGEPNSSVVSNDATTASTTKRTEWFKNDNNANYLALDTEGGTLWRSLDTITSTTVGEDTTYGLGAAREVAATGTYLDTLVQFTVPEDEAPTVGEGDKLAIWLQAGEGTTNLMVKAKAWSIDGELASVAADFVIANSPVEPGVWHRLTVKAVQTIITPSSGYIIPAFQIYIDGTEVAATTPQISAELQAVFTQGEGTSIWLQGMADLAAANKLFPTLAENPQDVTDVTLQGVGFQGTGAVDEIVWTEDNPIPAAVVEFTLTYSGDSNTTLGAVTYTIDGGAAQTPTEGKIPDGATVSIAAPSFTEGYQLAAFTVGGTAVASPTFPYTFTMAADTTVEITSEPIPVSYQTYVGEDAALKTQYDTWKQAVGFDDSSTSTHEKQFLLNVDEETTVADDALQIDSITENATAGWDIVVSTTVTGAALSDGSKTTYNGYLLVKAADTLAGLASATPVAYPVTAVTGGKVSITVTSGKFMKVELTTTAPAQN